jgi:hypothetical protein
VAHNSTLTRHGNACERTNERALMIPCDVVCVRARVEMEASLQASWVMSLEPFKQKAGSLRSGNIARLNRREAARWCLNLLASRWTEEEETAMESLVSSLIRPQQPMGLRYILSFAALLRLMLVSASSVIVC